MNNRGAIGVGVIIILAIMLIFGLALAVPIAQSQGTLTNIGNSSNASYTLPANGTIEDLVACGQLNTSNVVIYNYTNASGDVQGINGLGIGTGNYSVNQSVGSDGYLNTRIFWNNLGGAYVKAGYKANVTCQFEPKGYNHDPSARGIAGLILVFTSIALIAVVIRKEYFDFDF